MRITHSIATCIEGTLDELLECQDPAITAAAPAPTLEEVLTNMAALCFLVETVAHLQGRESTMLPTADLGRELIKRLQPIEGPKPPTH